MPHFEKQGESLRWLLLDKPAGALFLRNAGASISTLDDPKVLYAGCLRRPTTGSYSSAPDDRVVKTASDFCSEIRWCTTADGDLIRMYP